MMSMYNLSINSDSISNVADKNLGFFLNSSTWYKDEYTRQLADSTTYNEFPYTNIHDIKIAGISDLKNIFLKYASKDILHINVSDLQFSISRELKDIVIPSLNHINLNYRTKNY